MSVRISPRAIAPGHCATWLAMLLLGSLPLGLGAATYKCRDANGEWTSAACMQVVTELPETAYMKYQRERQAERSKRLLTRAKLGMYCFRLDTKASFYDCVDAQMQAYEDINMLAKQVGVASSQGQRLAQCVSRNLISATDVVDYSRARACYLEPQ